MSHALKHSVIYIAILIALALIFSFLFSPYGSFFWKFVPYVSQGCILLEGDVCGIDGITYGSYCEADEARVWVAYEGSCSE